MSRYVIVVIFAVFFQAAEAGYKTNLAIAATGSMAARVILPAVLNGVGRDTAIRYASTAANSPILRGKITDILIPFIVTMAGTKYAINAEAIMSGAGLYDNQETKDIVEDLKLNYSHHVETLHYMSNKIDREPEYRKSKCINKKLIYNKTLVLEVQDVVKPVAEWDVGAYKTLLANHMIGDSLEHDHIPSRAAVKEFLRLRDGSLGSNSSPRAIVDNATAVEITQSMHRAGRTYGGRNNLLSSADARNLRLATIKDMAFHFADYRKLSPAMISAFTKVYWRNRMLCLYEGQK